MSQYPLSETLYPTIVYESLPSSTCLGRHMYSDLWTRFHLLFSVKCVLFLSYSSSQLTPKPRNLRKILWVIHQKIIVETFRILACTTDH